ncbi:MAG: FkbM family methyltransferase [Flavobacteriales bacterium]|jgi:FkbM family methyltransferase|nr:FkbM family methyltransferase [Flavobacteriales bacterium]
MKRIIRKIIDKAGLSIFRHSRLPIGADYRKTIRYKLNKSDIKIVFDVGANIGQFSLHCHEVFDESYIYSFEPIKSTFDKLKNRTRIYNNISCFNIAFGNEKGVEEIFLRRRSIYNSLNPLVNVRTSDSQESQQIEIDTIDLFCKSKNIEHIDILKVDTEGFDLNVLKGAESMIIARKVKFILIEVTFDKDNAHNSSYNIISSFLKEFDYKIHGFYNQSLNNQSTRMNYCDALFFLQPDKK